MKTFTHTGALVFVFGFWFMLLGGGALDSPRALWAGVAIMVVGVAIGAIEVFAARSKSAIDTKRGRV